MEFENQYVLDVYNKIAKQFDRTRSGYFWACVRTFIEKIDKNETKKILDLGCGNGRYIPLFLYPTHIVTCLDNSIELLKIVNEKYPWVQTIQSDVVTTGFNSDSFDHIISIAVIHHLVTEIRRIYMIKEIYRVLKVNGTCLITAWATSTPTDKFTKFNNFKDSEDSEDYLVPWAHKFVRFYHLFKFNELENLIEKAGLEKKLFIQEKIYEFDNHAVILQKII